MLGNGTLFVYSVIKCTGDVRETGLHGWLPCVVGALWRTGLAAVLVRFTDVARKQHFAEKTA